LHSCCLGSEHPVPDSSQSTCSEHPVPDSPCLPDNTQLPCPEHPSHNSSDANHSQTITEFADDIPNPTLNHELQSRIPEHVYKTKHATEIASDWKHSQAEKLDELRSRYQTLPPCAKSLVPRLPSSPVHPTETNPPTPPPQQSR